MQLLAFAGGDNLLSTLLLFFLQLKQKSTKRNYIIMPLIIVVVLEGKNFATNLIDAGASGLAFVAFHGQ